MAAKFFRDLPAWMIVLMFVFVAMCGVGVGASVVTYYGSLNVPDSGSITANQLSASEYVCTDGSKNLSSCATPPPVTGNFGTATISSTSGTPLTINASATSGYNIQFNGASSAPFLQLKNNDPHIPNLGTAGSLYFYATRMTHANVGHIDFITAGGAAPKSGGGITFHVTDPKGIDHEPIVMTAEGHLFAPQDEHYVRFDTHRACSAGVTCATTTWRFKTPFHNISGAGDPPVCDNPGVMDENHANAVWAASIRAGTLSATSVTFNLAPLSDVRSGTTLDVYEHCWVLTY